MKNKSLLMDDVHESLAREVDDIHTDKFHFVKTSSPLWDPFLFDCPRQ